MRVDWYLRILHLDRRLPLGRGGYDLDEKNAQISATVQLSRR